MSETTEFDRLVGKIAGAIYSDVARQFPQPPLLLVPAVTYKVRKIMEQVSNFQLLSKTQMETLANDIKSSIVPILASFDIESSVIHKIGPTIEAAAYHALSQEKI